MVLSLGFSAGLLRIETPTPHSSFTSLSQLRLLDVSHNCFTTFPSLPLATLPAIHTVDLSENQIAHWPSCQFDVPKLRKLDVRHNPLLGEAWGVGVGLVACCLRFVRARDCGCALQGRCALDTAGGALI